MIVSSTRRSLARACRAALALPLLVLLPSSLLAQKPTAAPPPVPDSLDRMNQAIDGLTRKVWPSVVQIMVTGYGARDEDGRGPVNTSVMTRQRSMGSGFVIDPEGYVMTNAHVVSGAQRVQIVVPPTNADGSLMSALSPKMTILPARIVGVSSEIDLALLKVEGLKAPALPLASYRDLRQGETVFAFGSPGGLRNTLTHGLVSAVARQTDPDSPLIYIQTDAPINPGNSGGPLVNVRGEVVGVNTFIMSQSGGNEGLGFAIPSATTRTVFRQLKQYGQLRRQEVGMSLQTITQPMAASLGLDRDSGVIVSDVWPNGPAEAAGVRIGDVLLSVDGQAAENLPTVNYFFRLRESDKPVEMVVMAGKTQKLYKITPVEQGSEFDSVSADDRSGAQPRRAARHHRHRDRSAAGRRREGPARSLRHHRRGARGRRRGRNPAAAARHHPQFNNEMTDLARRLAADAAGAQAWRTGHPADPARGAADVRLVHDGVSEELPFTFRAESVPTPLVVTEKKMIIPTKRSFHSGLAAMSLVALASVYASGQQPAVKIPEPGVPQVMTLEGKFVRVAYNNEGYVILGYQIANRTVGEDWIMLDVGITGMEKAPTYELKREALSLDTPDGTLALPSIEEYRENESKAQALQNRMKVQRDSINYFPPWISGVNRLGFFADLGSRAMPWNQADVTNSRACVGQLYFHVPGGTKHGQYWLNVKFAQSVVRVPFRLLTKEEEKTLGKNYGDIKKQVDAAFRKQK